MWKTAFKNFTWSILEYFVLSMSLCDICYICDNVLLEVSFSLNSSAVTFTAHLCLILICHIRFAIYHVLAFLFLILMFLQNIPAAYESRYRELHFSILSWKYQVFKKSYKTNDKISKSSHQTCSVKKGVLRNFAKFTGKNLCQRLFFNKVAGGACNFIKFN